MSTPIRSVKVRAAVVAAARVLVAGMAVLAVLLGLTRLADRRQTAPAAGTFPAAAATPTEPLALPARSPTAAARTNEGQGAYAIEGRVVSLDGGPVGGARVVTAQGEATTRSDGSFRIPAGRLPTWVTVTHPDFLPRTRAAAPETPLLVRLTPDDGETISLLFAGDTMFGRRFYDADEDGSPDDGLLRLGDGAAEHLALLADIRPLLESTDLTVLNLESALSDNPYIDPTQPRPSGLHPTKEYLFLSHTSAAAALRQAGVDLVGLANNHQYDALDLGIVTTEDALRRAGFSRGAGFFGAGLSEAEAWQPAVAVVRGQSIAFLGCTTITRPLEDGVPATGAISYVASDVEGKGGAAGCTEAHIQAAVQDAARRYDMVVFMVHGGQEYESAPTEVVSRMTNAARKSGARLVIGHHVHVPGGLEWDGSSLVAQALGNLVFDQTIWPALETNLLVVDVRRGQVVRAYLEPLAIEGSLPKGLTGHLADSVVRNAAGPGPGPWVLENGALEVDLAGKAEPRQASFAVKGAPARGTVFQVADGWWVSDFSGTGSLRNGRDILWVGAFEDEDVDAQYQENAFWGLASPYKVSGREYAFEGQAGVRLERGARDSVDAVLSPVHRILIEPGGEMSVAGMIRANRPAEVSLQLSWYMDTRGPSAAQSVWPVAVARRDRWQAFRFDAKAPTGAVAAGLFVRLAPPASGLATADVDNLRLIEWSAGDAGPDPQAVYVRVTGDGKITLSRLVLPGGESAAPEATLVELGE